jgi:hypothetical protein
VDPEDGKLWHLLVSDQTMDLAAKRGMMHAKLLAHCVPEVVLAPFAIFRGVREEGERNFLCYCGRPKHAYARDGETTPPYQGEVFLVFVSDERVIYNWRWEPSGSADGKLPEGHEARFDERVL